MVTGLKDQTVLKPEPVTLECEISSGKPEAEIHWYKGPKEIKASKKYSMSYAEDIASLTIKPSDTNDSDQYRCEAVNKLGRVETSANITVSGKLTLKCHYVNSFKFYVFVLCLFRLCNICLSI